MAELLSHIVTEDGVDRRISDIEARSMISRVQEQIGNIDLSNLDLELPSDPEFNTITVGTTTLSQEQFLLFLDFLDNIAPIEGVYF